MKLCGLWRPDGQLGRPFWAKPVLRRSSGPRIGSVRASSFVDDFVSGWGKRGAYRLLLEPTWSQLIIISLRLVAWLFAAKRRPISLLQPLGDCLRCFLLLRSLWVFPQVAGFHLNDCIELNTLLPLVGPPCPSRLLPKFSAQKEDESWSFQSIPLLIKSINLKRDGVGICLGKDVGRWSIEGFLTPPSFRHRVNYIG